MDTSSVIESLT